MKYLLIVLVMFCSSVLFAQDCDVTVLSDGTGEYTQREKSVAKAFRGKGLIAELWTSMSGKYIYLNMQIRDTVANVVLRNSYGAGHLFISFKGNKGLGFSLHEAQMGSVFSVPLNDAESKVGITYRENDSNHVVKDPIKVLEAFFKEQAVYISFSIADNIGAAAGGSMHSTAYAMREEEAVKIQEAVRCMLKATQ